MINPLEIAESPYYAELKSIKESTNEVGLYVYTITIMVNMEDAEFKFEQDLTWFEGETKVSDEEIKKYFNAKMLGEDIDLSDMNCYTFSSKCDLDYQMEQAYISPDC
tara:strand:+ start:1483 stop:1803 length:321 start_codon:yes stop_codon:yes gene_type:complete